MAFPASLLVCCLLANDSCRCASLLIITDHHLLFQWFPCQCSAMRVTDHPGRSVLKGGVTEKYRKGGNKPEGPKKRSPFGLCFALFVSATLGLLFLSLCLFLIVYVSRLRKVADFLDDFVDCRNLVHTIGSFCTALVYTRQMQRPILAGAEVLTKQNSQWYSCYSKVLY